MTFIKNIISFILILSLFIEYFFYTNNRYYHFSFKCYYNNEKTLYLKKNNELLNLFLHNNNKYTYFTQTNNEFREKKSKNYI